MKKKIKNLIKNPLFILLLNGAIAHTVLMAAIMSVMQVPPDSILDSGLKEIILIFED